MTTNHMRGGPEADPEITHVANIRVIDDGWELLDGQELPQGVSLDDEHILHAVKVARGFMYFDFASLLFKKDGPVEVRTEGVDLEDPSIIDLRMEEPAVPSFPKGLFKVGGFVGEPILVDLMVTPEGFYLHREGMEAIGRYVDIALFEEWLKGTADYCKFLEMKYVNMSTLQISADGGGLASWGDRGMAMGDKMVSDSLVVVRIGEVVRKFLADNNSVGNIIFHTRKTVERFFPDGAFDSGESLSTTLVDLSD